MSERGRKPGFRMTNEHRDKIKNSNILNALIECAEGTLEMSSTRATVALGLMRKVMPDLASTELTGDSENPVATISRIELVGAEFPSDHPALSEDKL